MCTSVCLSRKKERKKERKVRSLTFFKERKKERKKGRTMWFVTCYIDKRKRKESRPGVKSAVVTTGWLEKVEMKEWKKERTKGEMSGFFVGVFQILKKERNDSKKERLKKLSDL